MVPGEQGEKRGACTVEAHLLVLFLGGADLVVSPEDVESLAVVEGDHFLCGDEHKCQPLTLPAPDKSHATVAPPPT